jgi:hypothetical protein
MNECTAQNHRSPSQGINMTKERLTMGVPRTTRQRTRMYTRDAAALESSKLNCVQSDIDATHRLTGLPFTWSSISSVYGRCSLVADRDFMSVLRNETLVKSSLLARPARASWAKCVVPRTVQNSMTNQQRMRIQSTKHCI